MIRHTPILAVLLCALATGCGPEAGAACKREGNVKCSDDVHILLCENGRWVDKGERVDNMFGIDGWCECEAVADEEPSFYCTTLQ